MMAIVGAKSGMLITLLSRVSRPMPTPTPAMATPIGMPMASTEPNDTMRITMAKARPMSSVSGGSNPPSAAPPISTVSPSSCGRSSNSSAPISPASVPLTLGSMLTVA